MRTKILKFSALIALFTIMISSAFAQSYPSASITLVDNSYTYYGDYQGTIYGYYLNGGIPTPLSGGTAAIGGLTLNSLNTIALPWTLPIDTQQNIYIIKIVVQKLSTGQYSNPNPASSSWFNTYYYYNNLIPVTVRF